MRVGRAVPRPRGHLAQDGRDLGDKQRRRDQLMCGKGPSVPPARLRLNDRAGVDDQEHPSARRGSVARLPRRRAWDHPRTSFSIQAAAERCRRTVRVAHRGPVLPARAAYRPCAHAAFPRGSSVGWFRDYGALVEPLRGRSTPIWILLVVAHYNVILAIRRSVPGWNGGGGTWFGAAAPRPRQVSDAQSGGRGSTQAPRRRFTP
jgi:hypothetical protein